MRRNREDEKAYEIYLQKIEEHNLPMKLVNVEYNFDVSRLHSILQTGELISGSW